MPSAGALGERTYKKDGLRPSISAHSHYVRMIVNVIVYYIVIELICQLCYNSIGHFLNFVIGGQVDTMATAADLDKRIADLHRRVATLQAKKKKLVAIKNAKARKERTHRLIEIGGIVEKYAGEIVDLQGFESYIKQYANAIKSRQTAKSVEQEQEADKES